MDEKAEDLHLRGKKGVILYDSYTLLNAVSGVGEAGQPLLQVDP
jgi:hypothetical protein